MKENVDLNNWLKDDDRPISVDIYCLVYNHGAYLREALDGMLMQETDFPFRIIIHDDASTDDSIAIIREYEKRFPDKIISVIEEKNLYQSGGSIWKVMVPYFTAKYIACCEGDDYWTNSRKLQKQVEYLEENLDCVAVYHNVLPVDENSQYDESLRGGYRLLDEGDYTDKEIEKFALKTQTASLVSRNYFPWMSEQDKDFYASVKCNGDEKNLILCGILGRVHYLPDVMAAHRRVFSNGASWTARQNKLSDQERMVADYKRFLEKCRFYEYFSAKKVYRYNEIILMQLKYLKKCHNLNVNIGKGVPMYAYIAFVPELLYRSFRYGAKRIWCLLRNKE